MGPVLSCTVQPEKRPTFKPLVVREIRVTITPMITVTLRNERWNFSPRTILFLADSISPNAQNRRGDVVNRFDQPIFVMSSILLTRTCLQNKAISRREEKQ